MALLAACFLALSCGGGTEKKRVNKTPRVLVEEVTPRPMARRVELYGSVEPTRTAKMASPAEGAVSTCSVREGDRVKAGDLLVAIGRDRAAWADLEAAREDLEREERDAERIAALVESGDMAAEALEQARVRVARAEASLATAELAAGDHRVRAPWEGIVRQVHVSTGAVVSPHEPLVDLYAPESLVVRFAVPETLSTHVKMGTSVEIRLDAHPDRVFPATVRRVFAALDSRTRTRTVEAGLTGEPDLLPGMFARIEWTVAQDEGALSAPVDAVLTTPAGEEILFVVVGDRAERRVVRTGFEADGRVQVLSGLSPGDRLVVAGAGSLSGGAPVRIADGGSKGDRGGGDAKGEQGVDTKNGRGSDVQGEAAP